MTSKQNGDESKEIDLIKKEYFIDVVRDEFRGSIIKKFKVEKALQPGENYGSSLMRVHMEAERLDTSEFPLDFIVKLMPGGEHGAMFKIVKLFSRECEMYQKIIPSLEKLYEDCNRTVKFSPKFYKKMESPEILIMEDLTKSNFKNIERQSGMNMKHVKAALSKLAKFHAASARLFEKQGDYSQQITEGPYTEAAMPILTPMQEHIWSSMVKDIKQWNCLQSYVEKIEKITPHVLDLNIKTVNFNPNDFNVLNHADFWSNNIMFQYDDAGEIKDVVFVDFQISRWGSPVQDLQYFLISSTSSDLKPNEFDAIIEFYYKELVDNLMLLEYSGTVPKLADLQVEMLKRGFISVYTSLIVFPVVIAPSNKNATTENFLKDSDKANDFHKTVYSNPKYIEQMERLLPYFDNQGLLDV